MCAMYRHLKNDSFRMYIYHKVLGSIRMQSARSNKMSNAKWHESTYDYTKTWRRIPRHYSLDRCCVYIVCVIFAMSEREYTHSLARMTKSRDRPADLHAAQRRQPQHKTALRESYIISRRRSHQGTSPYIYKLYTFINTSTLRPLFQLWIIFI